jgi:hypothetical protein
VTDDAGRRASGRALLLSAAIATLPLAGCVPYGYSDEQHRAYSAAFVSKSPAEASDFIRRYPDSPLVRDLLVGLPASTVKRLAPDAVKAISPSIIRTLPPDVLALLKLAAPKPAAPLPVRVPQGGY